MLVYVSKLIYYIANCSGQFCIYVIDLALKSISADICEIKDYVDAPNHVLFVIDLVKSFFYLYNKITTQNDGVNIYWWNMFYCMESLIWWKTTLEHSSSSFEVFPSVNIYDQITNSSPFWLTIYEEKELWSKATCK